MYRIQNRFNQYQLQDLFTVDAHEYEDGDDDSIYTPAFFEKNAGIQIDPLMSKLK
jgi:hypothetical protein